MSVMYLLDTNVVSELRRTRPHGAVLAWLAKEDGFQHTPKMITGGKEIRKDGNDPNSAVL